MKRSCCKRRSRSRTPSSLSQNSPPESARRNYPKQPGSGGFQLRPVSQNGDVSGLAVGREPKKTFAQVATSEPPAKMESKATNTTFYVDVDTKKTTTPVKGALKPKEVTVGAAAVQKKPVQSQAVSYALPNTDLPSTNRGLPQQPAAPKQPSPAPAKQQAAAPAPVAALKALPKLVAKRTYAKCHLIRRMMLLRLSSKILLQNLNLLNNEKFKQFSMYFSSQIPPTLAQARQLLVREVMPVLREVDLGQNSLSLDPASLLADPKRQAALVVALGHQKHLAALTEAVRKVFYVPQGAPISQQSSIRLLGTPS